MAIASGLSFFNLGRRDRVERDSAAAHEPTAFAPDRSGDAMQLAFLAVLIAGAWENRGPGVGWESPGVSGVIGVLVLAAGVWLRRDAARALGRPFTVGLSVLSDHELVDDGPYRWLRHPNYAGLLMVALGTALMMRSTYAIGVTLAVWLPLALMRISKEEHALAARLGAAYVEYARGRWCLVPGVY
jgi:protein-S-isoprenylcysteine O-methyltransferase Ste14